jgi:hypothetical protein
MGEHMELKTWMLLIYMTGAVHTVPGYHNERACVAAGSAISTAPGAPQWSCIPGPEGFNATIADFMTRMYERLQGTERGQAR